MLGTRKRSRRRGRTVVLTSGDSTVIKRKVREGINRQQNRTRPAATLAPTPRQVYILALMPEEPIRLIDLARKIEISSSSISSSLYSLQTKGLVEKVPNKGWRKIEE
jgi:DNA-binding MarR family transcriptional regulator